MLATIVRILTYECSYIDIMILSGDDYLVDQSINSLVVMQTFFTAVYIAERLSCWH